MNFQAALTYGLPGARVAKALADWQVNELPGEYYQMLNASGEDIGLLLKAFGLEIPAKIYTNGDIRLEVPQFFGHENGHTPVNKG